MVISAPRSHRAEAASRLLLVLVGLYQFQFLGDGMVVIGKDRHKQFFAAQHLQSLLHVEFGDVWQCDLLFRRRDLYLTGMLLDLFLGQPLAYGIDEHSDLDRFCDEVIHAFLDEHALDIADHIGEIGRAHV